MAYIGERRWSSTGTTPRASVASASAGSISRRSSAFADPARIVEDDLRYEYGEPRFRLYGRVAGRLFVIVFTLRDGVHRIISARKANRREIRRYGTGKIEG